MGTRESLKRLNLRGLAWKLRTGLAKKWIVFQERFGWYTYGDWIRQNESPLPDGSLSVNESNPLSFAIMVISDQGRLAHIEQTIQALQKQEIHRWVARILTGESRVDKIPPELALLLTSEPRLQFCSYDETQSQADVLKSCLDGISADWVMVLSSGDTISSDALEQVAAVAKAEPQADIIYTDEDQLSPDGQRRQPFFKPGWSPEMLLSRNYLLRSFLKRGLLIKALGLSQDFDEAIFRYAEGAGRVVHLNMPLVHVGPDADYAWFHPIPSPQAVASHLGRLGLKEASANLSEKGQVQVTWMHPQVLASLIIPTKDNAHYLRICLKSILARTSFPEYEIILVENGSREEATRLLYEELRSESRVRRVDYSGKFNFSAALNLGAREARGDLLVFLNNDIEALDPGWLSELARWAFRPEVGAVGAQLLYPDGTIQHAGIILGLEGHASHIFAGELPGCTGPFGSSQWFRNYSAVTGACMAVRQEVFDQIGRFDEGFELAFSDVDFCLRVIQGGYRVVYTPFVRLLHHEGRTRFGYIPPTDIRLGARRVEQIVKEGDPFYNANLSLSVRIPTLKRPWEEQPFSRLKKIVLFYS